MGTDPADGAPDAEADGGTAATPEPEPNPDPDTDGRPDARSVVVPTRVYK